MLARALISLVSWWSVNFQTIKRLGYVTLGSIAPGLLMMVTYRALVELGLTEAFVETYNLILNSQLLGGIVGSAFSATAVRVAGASGRSFKSSLAVHIKIAITGCVFYSLFWFVLSMLGTYVSILDLSWGLFFLALLISLDIYVRSWFIGAENFGLYAITSMVSGSLWALGFVVSMVIVPSTNAFYTLFYFLIFGIGVTFFIALVCSRGNSEEDSVAVPYFYTDFIPLVMSGVFISTPFIIFTDYFRNTDFQSFNKLSISLQIFSLVVFIPNIIVKLLSPKLMWSFQRDLSEFRFIFFTALKSGLFTMGLLVFGAFFLVEQINIFYDNAFSSDELALVIWISCAAFVGAQYPFGTLMLASGRYWLSCLCNLSWFMAFLSIFLFYESFSYKDLAVFLAIAYSILLIFNVSASLLIFRPQKNSTRKSIYEG